MGAKNATAFIPEIWNEAVVRTLEDNLVALKVVWDKSSEVKKAGDTVYFNGLADPAITGSYDGSLTYEELVSSSVALLVDQQNTYAFRVDDVEQAMANVDLKGSQAKRAGYQLAKQKDSYIFGATIYNDASNTITATVNEDNVLSTISHASRLLDEANVMSSDKWIVIAPWVKEAMENAGIVFQINTGMSGTGGLAWAQYRDFTVYVTNNLTELASTPETICLAGSGEAIGYANAILKTKAESSKDSFGAYMAGLDVFGAKVIKPDELVKLDLTYTAPTGV